MSKTAKLMSRRTAKIYVNKKSSNVESNYLYKVGIKPNNIETLNYFVMIACTKL